MLRSLQVARRSALKVRTQAANQLHALVVTAPDRVRTRLRQLSRARLVETAAAFRPRLPLTTPTAAVQLALKSLAVLLAIGRMGWETVTRAYVERHAVRTFATNSVDLFGHDPAEPTGEGPWITQGR
jgi:hypothetical protein